MKIWFSTSAKWMCCWMLALAVLRGASPASDPEAKKESLMTLKVNGRVISESEPVVEWQSGRIWIPVGVIEKAQIAAPPVRPLAMPEFGQEFYPLDSLPGVEFAVDTATQTMNITVPASLLSGSSWDGLNNIRTNASRSAPGLFINHDFQMFQGYGRRSLSGLVEGGLFSRFGVLTSQFAGGDLTNHLKPIRLNTQFFRDFPEAMSNLTIGDSISAISPWARSVYYAGVRYASKFATQPGFVPIALPGLSSVAAQPSTVDVYVNNVKSLSRQIDAGPFSISNIPTLTDQGQIRMVVTDTLGRQQVITESYIRSSQLLRPGVSDFTYEGGMLRRGYGFTSNQYESYFLAGTHRRGITEHLTWEGRLEYQPTSETAGMGLVYAIRHVGTLAGGAATSVQPGYRTGQMYYAQFSRQQRSFGLAAQLQSASRDFRQVGLADWQLATKKLLQGQISKSIGSHATIAAGYLQRDGRTELNARVLTTSIGLRMGRSYLNVAGTYSLLDARQHGMTVSWVRTFGERTTAMATGAAGPDGNLASVEVNRSVPLGPGYGYRVRSTNLDQQGNDAGFYYQTSQGYYGLEASERNASTTWRFLERGSLVFLRRQLMVSRWLNDSFGVVEVPRQKGIPVYVNHQLAARTDGRGLALLPWLVSYNRNTVNLDDSTLPSDVTVDLEERTVVPMARSAVYVRYQPAVMGGATLILQTPDGAPVPSGAVVKINGGSEAYEVALHGEVFVVDISYPTVIHAEWDEHRCEARIDKAPLDNVVPRIGPLVCKTEK